MAQWRVRAATPADAGRIATAGLAWSTPGDSLVVVHDTSYDTTALPALIAERADGTVVGMLSYTAHPDALEVVSLAAEPRRGGIGTALLAAAYRRAGELGLSRVWLVTTNDNLDALRFYQRRGMRITGVDPGAVDRARRRKPSIPLRGDHGIGLHDEIRLEGQVSAAVAPGR
ncbi:N-acetyltransferase [Actinocatenispora thailandica]|uniref:N-acetyltransferase n=1 Tax=Actinocatenispora thailandica TaxID=227318 RepID=A0A7R7DNH9_9ACTN|nr:GNAT family N-acetyltransferase [Actinocatenispora thailandica]BCJ34903.1 N-acetyltransferase [Actinocatenispora thailandica]